MKQLKRQIFSLILLLICSINSWATLSTITRFHVITKDNQSRLIFTASNPISYLLFTLTNPDRLVLDIKNAHLATKFNKHLLAKTTVKNIRIGSQKANY